MRKRPKVCLLCQTNPDLVEGHIVPSFVGKYLKDTSVTGKIRLLEKPNIAFQDIFKEYLFCHDCEELMCKEEKYFAGVVFHPFHYESQTAFDYNYHLGRFCAIQSFRVLVYYDFMCNEFNNLKPSYSRLAKKAVNCFRNFIRSGGKQQNEFSNHIFFRLD